MGVLDGKDQHGPVDWFNEQMSTLLDTHETEISTIQGANTGNVGAAAGTGVVAVETGYGDYKTTVLTLTNTPIVLVDNAGVVAHGGLKVYDFPLGLVYVQACVLNAATTLSAAGVDATWEGDVGVGTVVADTGNTLASTEQNIIPTTEIAAAVASVGICDCVSTASEHVIFDGTGGAIDVYINMLVDDANHDVTSTPTNIILNGTMRLNWIYMGDI